MTKEKDVIHEALRRTELALARVLHAADFIRQGRSDMAGGDVQQDAQQLRVRDSIIHCVRKLRINRELGEYYYVAVAGGQSAGKTRIIRELYGLDGTWLEDNEGRGEHLPVFIIETLDITEPYATQIVLDPETRETEEVRIDPAAFRRLIKGENPYALYPKLHVPARHFLGGQAGFVLLPGFEVQNEANASWQEVMRHTLQHALGCLFVTDKTRLADGQQLEIQRVAHDKFGGREFAVAISKTENASPEDREALRQRAVEVFKLRADQLDQVVCTGIGSAFVAEWSAKLIAALDANSRSAASSFECRLKDLGDIADDDVERILIELDRLMQRGTVHQTAGMHQRDEIMQLFSDASAYYRRRLEKMLTKKTQERAAGIQERAVAAYIKEEEGFENTFVNNIKRFFTTTSGEREKIHLDRVISRWSAQDLHASDFTALSMLANDRLDIPCDPSTSTFDQIGKAPVQALGYDKPGGARAAGASDSESVRAHMVRLLQPERDGDLINLSSEEQENLSMTIKLIPALTMEYLRINQAVAIAATQAGGDISTKLETQSLGEFIQATVNGLPQFKSASTNLLRTIGCILAVDVAIDGTVDTIPGLVQAIFGGGNVAAAGLGATLSMAAGGVMMLGYIGYQATTAAQRVDAAHRGFIRSAISDLAAKHVDRWMEVYDDAMERVEDRLRTSLNKAYNLNAHVANHDALLRAMAQLEKARLNLVRNVDYAKHSLV